MTNEDIVTLVHQVLTTRDHEWVTEDGRRVPNEAEVAKTIENLVTSNREDVFNEEGMTLTSSGGILAERYWIDENTWYDDVYVYVGRYQP